MSQVSRLTSHVSTEKRFAFFDLDLTLVPFDTQLVFCNYVLRAEGWRRLYVFFFAPFAVLYLLKLVGDEGAKRAFLSYLWRMPRERLKEHVRSFVSAEFPSLVYEEMANEIRRHKSEGRIVVLNTASPAFYAEAMAENLGCDHCFATRVAVGERMAFVPRFDAANNKGEAKIEAMRAILPRGVAPPFADSFAYSDSSADLPMLRLAEHPVMIHPSARLRRAGEEAGWEERRPAQPYRGRTGQVCAMALQLLGLWRARGR